jgi:2,4-dienoyl-CoA reductase-like NADH-dependent reductase (Old Yellow Enzyme family)
MALTDILFTPFTLNNLVVPNRIAMAPMTRNLSPDRVPGDDVAEYYRRRAAGGVGLIITEGVSLANPASAGYADVPRLSGEASLAGWKNVVDRVHGEGGTIMPQLWHVGGTRMAEESGSPEIESKSPSGLFGPGKENGSAMSEEEVADAIADFAEAAKNAMDVGFDGVEIHGAHGYLIDQFFWSGTNLRDDRFGGDALQRESFAVEVTKAIRAATRPDYPIILRFSQWKSQDYEAKLATSAAELEAFAAPLVDAGVDCFHCSTRRYWEPEFDGSNLNLAGWTKKVTGKPTITVGSIGLDTEFFLTMRSDRETQPTDIDELCQRMETGEFDMAAVGRALIANDDWPILVREGRLSEAKAYSKKLLEHLI